MPAANSNSPGSTWLLFALMTVGAWGVYGVLLHLGQSQIGDKADPVNNRYKAFLFVGIAYFLVAILAPLVLLKLRGAAITEVRGAGALLSLVAGVVGAVGAFGVLLAFGAAPSPVSRYVPVIMAIIFAGAPIVNAVVSLALHPPEGGLASIRPQFFLGIVLAAVGGCLVSLYKDPKPPVKPTTAHAQPASLRAGNP